MRILITGASGCIGHYLVETLLQVTDCDLVLVARNPAKLKLDGLVPPRVEIVTADLRDLEGLAPVFGTIDTAILAATAWGDPQETLTVNVENTLQLMQRLDPQRCQQIIYFSTASILDYDHNLLPQAGELGTDYIRSKYECYRRLQALDNLPPLSVVFPTLVLGGDDRKPASHISAGLPDALKWAGLARWFCTEGSFHFLHARDIAQVVCYLATHPSRDRRREYILGNPAIAANELIGDLCDWAGKPIRRQISLTPWLVDGIIKLFRIQMAPWDRYCLQKRHLTHRHPVTPANFGLTPYCPTLKDALRLAGLPCRQVTGQQ